MYTQTQNKLKQKILINLGKIADFKNNIQKWVVLTYTNNNTGYNDRENFI